MRTTSQTSKNPKKTRNLAEIETVKITDLKPYWDAVHVDLSRLSQPLLLHLVTLVKQLLQWFKKFKKKKIQNDKNEDESQSDCHKESSFEEDSEDHSFNSLMHRLCAVATAALSVLMVRYPDTVVDAAQDMHIVRDIISIALQPTSLSFFPVLSNVNKMWVFAQSRVLEQSSERAFQNKSMHPKKAISGNNIPGAHKNVAESSPIVMNLLDDPSIVSIEDEIAEKEERVKEGREEEEERTQFKISQTKHCSIPPILENEREREKEGVERERERQRDPLLFDLDSRAARRVLSDSLSCQFGIPALRCLLLLDFFMGDIDAVSNYLRTATKENSYNSAHVDQTDQGFEVEKESAIELSDSLLRNTSVCDSFYELKSDLMITPWETLVPSDAHLDRLIVSTAVTGDEHTFLTLRSSSASIDRNVFALAFDGGGGDGDGDDGGCSDGVEEREGQEGDEVERELSAVENRLQRDHEIRGEGDEEGESNLEEGSSSYAHLVLGCCLARCDEEGPSQIPKGPAMHLCMSPGAVRIHTIVSTYDHNLGFTTCEQIESTNLRLVSKYYDRPVDSVSNLVQDLDMSLTILRLREIAAQLLGEGNLNLHSDTESIEDWLRLLKLLVFSDAKVLADGADVTDGTDIVCVWHILSLSRHM